MHFMLLLVKVRSMYKNVAYFWCLLYISVSMKTKHGRLDRMVLGYATGETAVGFKECVC